MVKADLVKLISQRTGIDSIAVQIVVEEFMISVKANLSNGENIYLRGFGTFGVRLRKQKVGRNISQGTSLIIPAHYVPYFKPTKDFKSDLLKNAAEA